METKFKEKRFTKEEGESAGWRMVDLIKNWMEGNVKEFMEDE